MPTEAHWTDSVSSDGILDWCDNAAFDAATDDRADPCHREVCNHKIEDDEPQGCRDHDRGGNASRQGEGSNDVGKDKSMTACN